MGYGNYSEVYFAINMEQLNFFKIGETNNARRRNLQLNKENYYILASAKVRGGEAGQLFVESYLRSRIESTKKATRIRKDYFECENHDISRWFFEQFSKWVTEANYILLEMECRDFVRIEDFCKSVYVDGELDGTLLYSKW